MSQFRHKAVPYALLVAFLVTALAAQGNPARRPSTVVREPGYGEQETAPPLGLARFNPFAAEPAAETYLASPEQLQVRRSGDAAKFSPSAKFASHVIRLRPAGSTAEADAEPPSFSSFLKILEEASVGESEVEETSADGAAEGQPSSSDAESSSSHDLASSERGQDAADGFASSASTVVTAALPGTMFPRPHQSTVVGDRLLLYFPVEADSANLPEDSRLLMPVGTNSRFAPPGQSVFQRSSATIRRESQP